MRLSALGRGCIVLTGHLGYWEAGAFIFPFLGYTTGVIAKPMRNPLVDDFFCRMRESGGNYIISSRKGARAILKSLQKNHLVGILTDQHLKGKGSVSAPFFGRPAHTTTIITQMAIRYQIPIVTAFSYRQPDNRCECVVNKMFFLEGDLSDEQHPGQHHPAQPEDRRGDPPRHQPVVLASSPLALLL